MKKLYLIFFIFLFCVSYVMAIPILIQNNMPNWALKTDDYTNLYATLYFRFDSGSVSPPDFVTVFDVIYIDNVENNNYTLYFSCDQNVSTCYEGAHKVKICLNPNSAHNDMNLHITSAEDTNFNVSFIVRVYNNTANIEQRFDVYYNDSEVVSSNYTSDYHNPYGNLLTDWGQSFLSNFPSYKTISLSLRLSIVVITLLVITFMLYLIFFMFSKSFYPIHHWSVFIVNIALFGFFLAINYIPIAFLVVIGLIAVALTFFRIKSGFSAPGGS